MNIILLISNNINDNIVVNQLKNSCQNLVIKSINNIQGYYLYFHKSFTKEEILNFRESLIEYSIDLLYLPGLLDPNKKSLFVFDMDSTLIKEEIIDEIARYNGIYDEVSLITEEAMQGKIDFQNALEKRCSLLKGIKFDVFEEIYKNIHINNGVRNFFEFCDYKKIYTIVLSGGFTPILEKFKMDFKISDFKANQLEVKDQILTGSLIGEIIDKYKKRDYLYHFVNLYKVDKNQVVSVGDGSNDLLMLESAYIGIGYKPKNGLKENIINWISHSSIESLLFLYD
jgi:phosphoserine phosphatase